MSAEHKRTISAVWQVLCTAECDYADTPEKWFGIGRELVHVAQRALSTCLGDEEPKPVDESKEKKPEFIQ